MRYINALFPDGRDFDDEEASDFVFNLWESSQMFFKI